MSESSVWDALSEDHDRIGRGFDLLRESLCQHPSRAAAIFGPLAEELVHHMVWEEEVLFPAVRTAAKRVREKGIESLAIDHDRLREQIEELRGDIGEQRTRDALASLDRLRDLLSGHNQDEELGIYKEADRFLSEAERARILALFASPPRVPGV